MIKKFAWDVFEKTGDINTFMEFRKIDEIERSLDTDKDINLNLERNMESGKWQV